MTKQRAEDEKKNWKVNREERAKKKENMAQKKEEEGLDGTKKMKMTEDKREMEARKWR